MSCVFCHKEETEETLICSLCVQKLLRSDIEDLKRVYKLALEKWPAKAEALLTFCGPIITTKEGQTLVRRKPATIENRKPTIRGRCMQTVGLLKRTTLTVANKRTSPIC